MQHRPRCDLPERDGIEELSGRQPVIARDGVPLHQRDDHEPAAVGESSDLECNPGEGEQPAGRTCRCREQRCRCDRGGAVTAAEPADRQLEQATADENEHEPRPDRRGRGGPGRQICEPAASAGRAAQAVGDEPPAGVKRDRSYRRPGARAGSFHPQGRCAREEESRKGENQDQAGDDEAPPTDERADRAAEAPRAEDGELCRCGTWQEVACCDRVFELARLEPAAPLDTELA
jgi:hypothetical protein